MQPNGPSTTEIQDWLVRRVASELEMNPDGIDVGRSILSYGIDSIQVVTIVAELEDWLGIRFSANPLEDQPTIESLAEFAAGLAAGPESTAG